MGGGISSQKRIGLGTPKNNSLEVSVSRGFCEVVTVCLTPQHLLTALKFVYIVGLLPQTETLMYLKTLMSKKTQLIKKFSRRNSKHPGASKHFQQASTNL